MFTHTWLTPNKEKLRQMQEFTKTLWYHASHIHQMHEGLDSQ